MVGNWLDYTIIALILLSVITGLFRGFIKEVIALCVWILAIWLAMTYSTTVSTFLTAYIADHTARIATAFIGILLLTLIAGGLLNALLSFILRRTGLSGTDRLLGMGFGLVRGVFIIALLMLMVKVTALPYDTYRQSSRLYSKFDPLVNWLAGYMPNFIEHMKLVDNASGAIDIKPVI